MTDRQSQVAEWMAAHGGSIRQCSDCLGVTYKSVQHAWDRIRRKFGSQAA